jgi:SAM-dependent methyltransferase
MADIDVSNPIDFSDPEQARQWVEDAMIKRPWRPDFFRAFAKEIRAHLNENATILELGSGPGLLAEEILRSCSLRRYVLLDASTAMHDIARERLLGFDARTAYVTLDFRSENWTDGLRFFHVVVTMQSVHEVRHWRHVAKLYHQIMSIIVPGGYFLMADHYVTAENGRNPSLYFSRDEQRNTLINAGFVDVVLVIDRGDMALYRARRI